ncbi:MAG: hypothetical protein ABII26_11275 [Pseudomonadota bacterium]
MAFGHVTNTNFLEYKDFKQNGNGYSFILMNKASNEKVEFYLLVRGLDFAGNTVYYKRITIDFLEGNGELMFQLSGYDERVSDVNIKYEKKPERDVRIVK